MDVEIGAVFPMIGKFFRGFSNDWKKCFQWVENAGGGKKCEKWCFGVDGEKFSG